MDNFRKEIMDSNVAASLAQHLNVEALYNLSNFETKYTKNLKHHISTHKPVDGNSQFEYMQ